MTGRGMDMTGRGATDTDMTGADVTGLFIFARFHAHPGKEKALEHSSLPVHS